MRKAANPAQATHEGAATLIGTLCAVANPDALGLFLDQYPRDVLAQAYRYLAGRDPRARATRAELADLLRERHAYLHADRAAEALEAARYMRARGVSRVEPAGTGDCTGYSFAAVHAAANDIMERGYNADAHDALLTLADIPATRVPA